MKRLAHLFSLVALAGVLLSSPSLAQAQLPSAGGNDDKPAEAEAKPAPPAEELEVQGTCLTPRQVWLQHLYWAGKYRDYDRAAICFDGAGLPEGSDIADLAERLLQHLDANSLRIDTEGAPTDPNYVDPNNEQSIYRDPAAPNFPIIKMADGRWMFSAEALHNIPESGLLKRLADKLPAWFHDEILGVRVWSYLGIILLIFIALLLQRTTVFVIRTYVRRIAAKSSLRYLEEAVSKADKPIGGLVMAAVFHIGFPMLLFPLGLSRIAMVGTKALAAYSFVWLAYRLIDVLAEFLAGRDERSDTKLDDQLVPLISKTLKLFVSVLGGIFVLQNLDVDVSSLLAGVGLGGLAFALAAKDTVANFFGSVMIFIDKPFQIDDWVVIGDCEGTVEEVGFRTTRVRTFYNSLVTLPNAIITNTKVDNYGRRKYRRYVTNLGLTYDTPPEKVQAFCEAVRAAIAQMPEMRKDYFLVEFKEFSDSALTIMVYCFMTSASWNDELRTRSNLNLEILRIAETLGVGFAFPTQTLHLDSMVKPGESKPGHSGSRKLADLKGVVESFGPGGERAMERGFELSAGYDCREDWSKPAEG
jgi:MscS family membrane protein